jgi:hypothetical protein
MNGIHLIGCEKASIPRIVELSLGPPQVSKASPVAVAIPTHNAVSGTQVLKSGPYRDQINVAQLATMICGEIAKPGKVTMTPSPSSLLLPSSILSAKFR